MIEQATRTRDIGRVERVPMLPAFVRVAEISRCVENHVDAPKCVRKTRHVEHIAGYDL
ncbi:hypothetical protein D9M68_965140 [compost metagenome]